MHTSKYAVFYFASLPHVTLPFFSKNGTHTNMQQVGHTAGFFSDIVQVGMCLCLLGQKQQTVLSDEGCTTLGEEKTGRSNAEQIRHEGSLDALPSALALCGLDDSPRDKLHALAGSAWSWLLVVAVGRRSKRSNFLNFTLEANALVQLTLVPQRHKS